jgi:uncharacterized metal-binding protein
MSNELPNCALCPIPALDRLCKQEDGRSPRFCPTLTKGELLTRCLEEYEKPALREFARQSSIQEGAGYGDRELGYARVKPVKPRILEVIEFARRMDYRRLGLVFCVGLRKEAKVIERLFSSHGFEVVSVICKVGRVPKETIGVDRDQQIDSGTVESMCNPIMQAMVVNEASTELNVLLGLCVGHDSLFLKHAEAPCTVLAVKDRLLGHNPLAAIHTLDSYYRSLKPAP